jgi:hypothetical protein
LSAVLAGSNRPVWVVQSPMWGRVWLSLPSGGYANSSSP